MGCTALKERLPSGRDLRKTLRGLNQNVSTNDDSVNPACEDVPNLRASEVNRMYLDLSSEKGRNLKCFSVFASHGLTGEDRLNKVIAKEELVKICADLEVNDDDRDMILG